MMTCRFSRITGAVLVAAAVALIARYTTRLITLPEECFFPSSFITHTIILILSLALIRAFSKGRPGRFGLTRGTYRFRPRILLWVLPTAVLTGLALLASPPDTHDPVFLDLDRLQHIIFVWVYASITEELLTRGLLQTLLYSGYRSDTVTRRLSMPVILSALFFGAMHLPLLKSMGAAAVPAIVLSVFLGYVAGRYRESSGSIIPAIIIHMLFNIGGTLPLWITQWLWR
jgi:membrane protease YdiL (CAAX protease family)